MPYGHIPNGFPFDVVETAIGSDYDLSKGKVREFRQLSAGLLELLKS